MTPKAMEDLEKEAMADVVRRRGLGGFSAEAEGLLLHAEMLLKIIMHMREENADKNRASVDGPVGHKRKQRQP